MCERCKLILELQEVDHSIQYLDDVIENSMDRVKTNLALKRDKEAQGVFTMLKGDLESWMAACMNRAMLTKQIDEFNRKNADNDHNPFSAMLRPITSDDDEPQKH